MLLHSHCSFVFFIVNLQFVQGRFLFNYLHGHQLRKNATKLKIVGILSGLISQIMKHGNELCTIPIVAVDFFLLFCKFLLLNHKPRNCYKHCNVVLQGTENVLDMTSAIVILPGQVVHAAFQIAVLLITALPKETVYYQILVRVIQRLTVNTAIRRQNQTPIHPASTKYFITLPSLKTRLLEQ